MRTPLASSLGPRPYSLVVGCLYPTFGFVMDDLNPVRLSMWKCMPCRTELQHPKLNPHLLLAQPDTRSRHTVELRQPSPTRSALKGRTRTHRWLSSAESAERGEPGGQNSSGWCNKADQPHMCTYVGWKWDGEAGCPRTSDLQPTATVTVFHGTMPAPTQIAAPQTYD